MFYGNLAPYLRSRFGKQGQFATGSLVFDLERAAHRGDAERVMSPKIHRKPRASR